MEADGPLLTSNLFLDEIGEVVLTLDRGGLSWEPVAPEDSSTSLCMGFRSALKRERVIKFSDVYAVDNILWGSLYEFISKRRILNSKIDREMYRFVVHGCQRSNAQQSLWSLASYAFGHNDPQICQLWVEQIGSYLSKEVQRPKNLLVFVHPLSGRGNGCRAWESVRPIFSRAKVKTKVIVTQRAGHACEIITSMANKDLRSLDGIIAVGGDGFFNEILNGLLLSRHKASYPPAPTELGQSVGDTIQNQQTGGNNVVAVVSGNTLSQITMARCPELLEKTEDDPLLANFEYRMPGNMHYREENKHHNTGRIPGCDIDLDERLILSFPDNWFRLGVIPAGSTDSLVISTTGVRDPVTSALHIVLGRRTHLDIAQLVSWDSGKTSVDMLSVRYAATFAGYGFFGDVVKESEKYRWMGPKRYDYVGTKVFLRHRSHEADIAFLQDSTPRSTADAGIQEDQVCLQETQKMICRVNCPLCSGLTNATHFPTCGPNSSFGFPPENTRWLRSKGRFHSVGAAIISCRNEKAPDGLVADAHLADGLMHLILIKECPRPFYLWHLTQLTKKGSDPLNFNFIEHHRTRAFTFVASTDDSVWNVDGELFQARQLSAQVFRGLVSLFASGPDN